MIRIYKNKMLKNGIAELTLAQQCAANTLSSGISSFLFPYSGRYGSLIVFADYSWLRTGFGKKIYGVVSAPEVLPRPLRMVLEHGGVFRSQDQLRKALHAFGGSIREELTSTAHSQSRKFVVNFPNNPHWFSLSIYRDKSGLMYAGDIFATGFTNERILEYIIGLLGPGTAA